MASTKIAPGSTILVTGADGFIGSAVVTQLLVQGFRVKGTSQSQLRLEEFKKKADQEFGTDKFEIVGGIPDLAVKAVLDNHLEGVSGLINVAADTSFGSDLKKTVQDAVSLIEGVLNSAKTAAEMKSVVLTSSRIAAFRPNGTSQRISDKEWFDEAPNLYDKVPDQMKGAITYASSKVAGERAAWKWTETEKPDFRVNTVLPDVVLGKIHNPAEGNYSTATGLIQFSKGDSGMLEMLLRSPVWFVDVEDVAKLHVAALIDETVDRQRIWAASAPFCASEVQGALKEVKPDYKERDVSAYPPRPDIVIDNSKSIALLEKHYGSGFNALKTAVKANLL